MEEKRRTFGSWMNAPVFAPGGKSPVVAYLRHSMIVWVGEQEGKGRGGMARKGESKSALD
jgi:hypothetical protein